MDKITAYLIDKYQPIGMIVYGSYANGTNNLSSDFDALLICDDGKELHDHSYVGETELDVFVYPKTVFESGYDIESYIQVWDGRIIIDETGLAAKLKDKAIHHINSYTAKSKAENEQSLAWCKKMLLRTKRNDMEGLYRLHWLLMDSLEIYFDLKGMYFFGPKKAIRKMTDIDPVSAQIYYNALREPTYENVAEWINRLKEVQV